MLLAEVMAPCLQALSDEDSEDDRADGASACLRARADFLFALHGQRPQSAAAKKAAYAFFSRTQQGGCRSLGCACPSRSGPRGSVRMG